MMSVKARQELNLGRSYLASEHRMQNNIDPKVASPQEYLQYLQAIWTTDPYPPIPRSQQLDVLADLNKKYPGLIANNVLKYYAENPPKSSTLQEVVDILFEDLTKSMESNQRREIVDKVAVGELQTRDANALCIKVPAGGYVILFNDGLMMLLHKLAKAVSSRVRIARSPLEARNLRPRTLSFEETPNYVYEIIARYLMNKHPIGPEIPLEHDQYWFSDKLRWFMELFVMGHELGHILEGHLSKAKILRFKIGREEITVLKPSCNQEYDADIRGLLLVMNARGETFDYDRTTSRSLAYAGPDFFFTIMDLIEKIANVKPESHPTAVLRRENLRNFISANEKGLALAKDFEEIIDGMWRIIYRRIKSSSSFVAYSCRLNLSFLGSRSHLRFESSHRQEFESRVLHSTQLS